MQFLKHVQLDSWAGHRRGPDGESSTGRVFACVRGVGPICSDIERTYTDLEKLGESLYHVVLVGVSVAYPTLARERPSPPSMTTEMLREWVSLYQVQVLREGYDATPYIAWMIATGWHHADTVVVVTHAARVVAVEELYALFSRRRVYDPERPRHARPLQRGFGSSARSDVIAWALEAARKNPSKLRFRDGVAEVVLVLPAWAGFRCDPDEYPSRGEVEIMVEKGVHVGAMRAAYAQLVQHAESIRDVIVSAVRERHALQGDPRDHFALSEIVLMDVQHDGLAYVGYVFACSWDEEHGLGVVMHGERVVAIDDADVALGREAAERDVVSFG